MATVVPTHLAAAVPEVAVYLKESVGNSTRIDYGTGTCLAVVFSGLRLWLAPPGGAGTTHVVPVCTELISVLCKDAL